MKKQVLLLLLLLQTFAGYSQYTFSGTVKTTTGASVANQAVYVRTDTTKWTSGMGAKFSLVDSTDTAGFYSVTLPSTTDSLHPIIASTENCTGPVLQNNHTYAKVNITSNFTKCVLPGKTISGVILIGGLGASNAKVLLLDKIIDSITGQTVVLAIDSAIANSSGNYSINTPASVPKNGVLIVRAFLQSSHPNYSSYFPTYYPTSVIWSGAAAISATTSVTANISLVAGTNPSGSASVSGDVVVGANKTTAVGDPVPGREIILALPSGAAVAYTYSDGSGKFQFPSLPYGTYQILGDVGGKTSTPLLFTLTSNVRVVNTIRFEDKSTTFNPTLFPLSVNNITGQLQAVTAYPNPANDMLYLSGLDAIQGSKQVRITDMAGRLLSTHSFAANEAAGIDVQALGKGMYLLHIATEEGNTTLKFSK
ncbi:MAG: T9SS type A sorting domain-containing protein [Bacteroidetes bacterium]|nr:T9SS type A sorting domain-containing protein [Bacteroidota bacterium]